MGDPRGRTKNGGVVVAPLWWRSGDGHSVACKTSDGALTRWGSGLDQGGSIRPAPLSRLPRGPTEGVTPRTRHPLMKSAQEGRVRRHG